MIKTIFKILGILILVIFELSLATKFSIFGAVPNLILILAIALVLRGREHEGFLVAGLGGLFIDLVALQRFGIYTLIFLLIVIVINYYFLKAVPLPNLFATFLIFVGSFIFLDSIIFLSVKMGLSWQILIHAFVNGLWGILIYGLIQRMIRPQEEIQLI